MLNLPDVTLVCCETRDHALMRLAIEDCVRECEFGDVLLFTNYPKRFGVLRQSMRVFEVTDWPDKLGWCRWIWFGAPQYVRTSHMLLVQWDAGVWDTFVWTDDFLQYDYIGAPWGWHKTKKVGNSGFGLKSTRLARYIADHAWEFPCDNHLEDDLLCRKYRPSLEERGFLWAPEDVAHRFAFECSRPSSTSRHFGYHAMFNWPIVLSPERVLERLNLVLESPTLRDSYMMKAFREMHPKIIEGLLAEKVEDSDASDRSVSREAAS